MTGILFFLLFLVSGCMLAWGLFYRLPGLIRVFLGCTAGLLMLMWFPCLFAFGMNFTRQANLWALGLAGFTGLSGAAAGFLLRKKRPAKRVGFFGDMPWQLLLLALPFLILSAYLLHTHILRPADGALHVGQSTYGDLCLHVGIATGMADAAFPPEYTILPGTALGYPFLGDSMAASLLLFGSSIREAFISTALVMFAMTYCGFLILAWEMTKSRCAAVVAFLLLFLNGGLGFAYSADMALANPEKFTSIFTQYYLTPANRPGENVYWVNVICDNLIPQRTLLCGWSLLMPALWLLVRALKEKKTVWFAVLGVLAGGMPMAHTHSFLGLGLLSAGCMAYCLIHSDDRRRTLRQFLLYAAIAVVLAAPQLFAWTFPQSVNESFSVHFRFNWVNNDGSGRLKDEYFWFWIKNVGPVYLLMVPAALACRKGGAGRALALGALLIYAAAELIQFQTNPYDNNKLFLVAFVVMLPLAARYLATVWDRLRGIRGRALLAAAFLIVSTLSGTLSIGRELVSDYQIFPVSHVEAAGFIREHTDKETKFLTGTHHNNPVSVLAGRKIVCGPGLYLYFHGVNYAQQENAVRLMYEAPADNLHRFRENGIDFVYISAYEFGSYSVDYEWFDENCVPIYRNADVTIYEMGDELYGTQE